ncbi:Baculoviral IAP repeat-containing protein 7-A, partial [Stegodyphus mimosarum]
MCNCISWGKEKISMALAVSSPSVNFPKPSLEPDCGKLDSISPESFDVPDEPKSIKNKADPSEQKIFEAMKYEINRLNSFRGKWPKNFIKPEDLAEAGFFYLQSEDRVQCPFCYVTIFDWGPGDRPLKEHLRKSPACPFLLSSSVGNVPLSRRVSASFKLPSEKSSYSSRTTSAAYKPKHPAMADIKRRLLTYKGWPLTMLTPQQLSECGLFYTGVSDLVTCYFCGGSLGNWDLEDDPWVEHAKFFPDCTFLALSRNQSRRPQKVNQRSCNLQVKLSMPVPIKPVVRHPPRALLNSEVVREAMKIFPESLVQKVVFEHFSAEGRNVTSLHELCEAILAYDENKKTTPAISSSSEAVCSDSKILENGVNEVKDVLLCKICMDSEKQVVFIPCGHLISCEKCAQALDNCAVCRTPITNRVRTYLS